MTTKTTNDQIEEAVIATIAALKISKPANYIKTLGLMLMTPTFVNSQKLRAELPLVTCLQANVCGNIDRLELFQPVVKSALRYYILILRVDAKDVERLQALLDYSIQKLVNPAQNEMLFRVTSHMLDVLLEQIADTLCAPNFDTETKVLLEALACYKPNICPHNDSLSLTLEIGINTHYKTNLTSSDDHPNYIAIADGKLHTILHPEDLKESLRRLPRIVKSIQETEERMDDRYRKLLKTLAEFSPIMFAVGDKIRVTFRTMSNYNSDMYNTLVNCIRDISFGREGVDDWHIEGTYASVLHALEEMVIAKPHKTDVRLKKLVFTPPAQTIDHTRLSVSIPSENLAAVLEALKPHLPATVTAAFVIPQAQQSTVMGKIFQIPSLEYQQVKVSCVHSTNATKDVPLTVRVVQTELTQLLQAATIL